MIRQRGAVTIGWRKVVIVVSSMDASLGSFETPPLLREIPTVGIMFIMEIVQLVKGLVHGAWGPMRVAYRTFPAVAPAILFEAEMCVLVVCNSACVDELKSGLF